MLRAGSRRADASQVTCPSCGAANDEGSQWCALCLHRYDAVPPTKPNLAESKNAFVRTGSTTLTRQTARGPLVFVEPGGDLQATVLSQRIGKGQGESLAGALAAGDSLAHLNERHTVLDRLDVPAFYVERYRAASEPAFAVFEPDGDALAVYRSGNPFVVRDGTGAPVARLHERKDRLELVEVGGGPIAQCWRAPLDLGWLIDEQWGLTVLEEPVVLDRRALVAFPLVCRLLFGRPPHKKVTDEQKVLAARVGLGIASAFLSYY
jgi:hypothetical protein